MRHLVILKNIPCRSDVLGGRHWSSAVVRANPNSRPLGLSAVAPPTCRQWTVVAQSAVGAQPRVQVQWRTAAGQRGRQAGLGPVHDIDRIQGTEAAWSSRCWVLPASSRCKVCSCYVIVTTIVTIIIILLSASLYFRKRGAYWDRLCRDVVGWLSRACTVSKQCILGL